MLSPLDIQVICAHRILTVALLNESVRMDVCKYLLLLLLRRQKNYYNCYNCYYYNYDNC